MVKTAEKWNEPESSVKFVLAEIKLSAVLKKAGGKRLTKLDKKAFEFVELNALPAFQAVAAGEPWPPPEPAEGEGEEGTEGEGAGAILHQDDGPEQPTLLPGSGAVRGQNPAVLSLDGAHFTDGPELARRVRCAGFEAERPLLYSYH